MPRMSSMYFRSATRSSSVRCSDTAEGSCAPSDRVVPVAMGLVCSLVVGGRTGSPSVARSRGAGRDLRGRRRASHSVAGHIRWSGGARRRPGARRAGLLWRGMSERIWVRRLRWRLRGATMWPAFGLAVVLDAILLNMLPIAGDQGPTPFPAVLLAGFFNL